MTRIRLFVLTLVGGMVLSGSAHAVVVNVPVQSSNTAGWSRSDGGTGTTMVTGGPAVWNATFSTSIPPGSTGISFSLDTFSADDKGVVELNGTIIGDAVIFQANGGAAGAGTFDFGLGGGNQAYTFVGFTPGADFPLPDGTTAFTLIVYINDTGTSNPSAPPLAVTFLSSFNFDGTLTFDAPATSTPTATAIATPSNTPTVTSTPTITNTPTIISAPTVPSETDGAPDIPALSGVGAAFLALLLAGVAVLVLARSRAS